MRALVTGVAGFIGSHLAERLVADGYEVIGVDAFTESYDRRLKHGNLASLLAQSGFQLVEADLATADLVSLVQGCDQVFHLAAQPGVRASWGDDFRLYLERNVWAIQRLLEALRGWTGRKLVVASSSSIYGEAERFPTGEQDLPRPISPYGVTKLAAERLCLAYGRSYGIPAVALRYFTVYGPRQRPDMAFSRFIAALHEGQEITVYGDGRQTRDFTYVADAVEATVQAATSAVVGEAINVGGGWRVTLLDVLTALSRLLNQPLRIEWQPPQPGDLRDTGADLRRARAALGYAPRVDLVTGLRAQVGWWQRQAHPTAHALSRQWAGCVARIPSGWSSGRGGTRPALVRPGRAPRRAGT